jgi:hypothetical protein
MPEKIESYKDLMVWRQAIELTVAVYSTTRNWPKEELYGLTSQARRAATSIPANIAEGYARESRPSYLTFSVSRKARSRSWKHISLLQGGLEFCRPKG